MDPMILVYIIASAFVLLFAYVMYMMFIKPKSSHPGIYKNPNSKRRKIPFCRGPDWEGYVKEVIEEEGGYGDDFVTLVIDNNGNELLIPHVNISRDVIGWNMKQLLADGDSPIVECSVDRNGIVHPERLDSITSRGRLSSLEVSDLKSQILTLKLEHAKMKNALGKSSDPANEFDKVEELADKVAKLKRSLYTPPVEGGDQEEGNQG